MSKERDAEDEAWDMVVRVLRDMERLSTHGLFTVKDPHDFTRLLREAVDHRNGVPFMGAYLAAEDEQ